MPNYFKIYKSFIFTSKAQNLIRILNLFEEKYLTIDEQKQIFINKKNFQLKYYQFNLMINILVILNLFLKKKSFDSQNDEKIFDDLVKDIVNKLKNCIQLHKKVVEENKNQLK
jgi:hypothetical protein